jgi:hypothetical protein
VKIGCHTETWRCCVCHCVCHCVCVGVGVAGWVLDYDVSVGVGTLFGVPFLSARVCV